MKRIDVEQLRDSIKSLYDFAESDYDSVEQELMRDLEKDYITEEEFESELRKHYNLIEEWLNEELEEDF